MPAALACTSRGPLGRSPPTKLVTRSPSWVCPGQPRGSGAMGSEGTPRQVTTHGARELASVVLRRVGVRCSNAPCFPRQVILPMIRSTATLKAHRAPCAP